MSGNKKNRVLRLWNKASKFPFGNWFFSWAVSKHAPYFLTINPVVRELSPGKIKVSMRKKYAVTNHIKTVHAIAMCNLCEYTAGLCLEAYIPNHLRWIPKGMTVSYLRKAKTDLIATCDLGVPDWDNISELKCLVHVLNKEGIEVMRANITMKISSKN